MLFLFKRCVKKICYVGGNNLSLHKFDYENEEQFIWRLGNAKDSGTLDMSWSELTDVINRELGYEDRPFSESAYRKPYAHAKKFYEAGVFDKYEDDSYIKEIQLQKDALYKEKRKLYDQRREYNKLLISDARPKHNSFFMNINRNIIILKYQWFCIV